MAATGDQNSCLMLSMANMQLAIENYGETDLSCLSYYLSGISQVAQIGEIQGKTDQGTLENILSKMLKVLEANQETQNGNQYFFLASIMLGSICIAKQQYEQAHLFFHGTMQKQLKYVGEVADHPFLEQTYLHLALLYKQLKNLNASLTMWQNLKKVHERQFGENKHYLSSDLKNIGTCQLGLNKADDAIESYKEAEGYLIDVLESGRLDEKETKDERIQLSAIYFSLYLSYLSKEDFDNATIYNEKSLATNIQIHGEFDVNISNNHYLASQMLLKQLKTKEACGRIDEALKIYAELQKKNDLGIQKTPVIGCKYMALKAKICKIMG